MGAVPGTGVVEEPRAAGYLRGQVFNRPQGRRGEWLLFSIIYFPATMPDFSVPSAGACPDLSLVPTSSRDCYGLTAYSVPSNFYPRGQLSPLPSSYSAQSLNFRFSAEEDAIDYPPGNKTRTIALNLAEVSTPYLFLEFTRRYSSGVFMGINPGLDVAKFITSRLAMSLAREYSGIVQPRVGGEYAPNSYFKFGTTSGGERLYNLQADTNTSLPRLNQQYLSIGAFIDVRNPRLSHFAPSSGGFAPFTPQLVPQGNVNQYSGSSLGASQYTIDEGLI